MAAIDPYSLTKAMAKAPMTAKQLVEALRQEGQPVSLQYVCDITSGRRTLKRNPALRRAIAAALDVPQHWIEHCDRPVEEAS